MSSVPIQIQLSTRSSLLTIPRDWAHTTQRRWSRANASARCCRSSNFFGSRMADGSCFASASAQRFRNSAFLLRAASNGGSDPSRERLSATHTTPIKFCCPDKLRSSSAIRGSSVWHLTNVNSSREPTLHATTTAMDLSLIHI
eukprot:1908991-Karenia_brevis.AAC.1